MVSAGTPSIYYDQDWGPQKGSGRQDGLRALADPTFIRLPLIVGYLQTCADALFLWILLPEAAEGEMTSRESGASSLAARHGVESDLTGEVTVVSKIRRESITSQFRGMLLLLRHHARDASSRR